MVRTWPFGPNGSIFFPLKVISAPPAFPSVTRAAVLADTVLLAPGLTTSDTTVFPSATAVTQTGSETDMASWIAPDGAGTGGAVAVGAGVSGEPAGAALLASACVPDTEVEVEGAAAGAGVTTGRAGGLGSGELVLAIERLGRCASP